MIFLQVSYIKAVDWYLIVSFLFVFAVLIEYTFVLYLTDRDKQFQKHEKKKKKRKKDERSHTCNRVYLLKSFIVFSGYIILPLHTIFMLQDCNRAPGFQILEYFPRKKTHSHGNILINHYRPCLRSAFSRLLTDVLGVKSNSPLPRLTSVTNISY